jgi:hypothetical protein
MTEPNFFTQRVPGFIDIREYKRANFEFTETQELLDHPYIQNWMEGENTKIFKQNTMIIVRTDTGKHFVVGYVKNPENVNLPIKEQE